MREVFKTEPRPNHSPKVVQGKSITGAPYTISVDALQVGQFMRDQGISHRQISGTTIIVERKRKRNVGSWDGEKNTIHLYPELEWQEYVENMETIDKLAGGVFVNKQKLSDLPSRFPDYAAEAPPERVRTFGQKLLERRLERELNKTLFHEISHAKDTYVHKTSQEAYKRFLKDKWNIFVCMAIGIDYLTLRQAAFESSDRMYALVLSLSTSLGIVMLKHSRTLWEKYGKEIIQEQEQKEEERAVVFENKMYGKYRNAIFLSKKEKQ